MVETTQSIFASDGTVALPRFIAEGGGRIVAAHFGTYDYTAACGITAAHQHMVHPACDFARHVMQVALAGTGIWLSDGATNIMPIGPREVVHRAWRLHAEHVRHSLVQRVLPGVGPAPRATADALCGRLRVFPRRARCGVRPPAQFRREGGAGDAGRRGVRRCGHRPGPVELFPARDELRRHHRGRSGREERADGGGAALSVRSRRSCN